MKKMITFAALAALLTVGCASAERVDFENAVPMNATDLNGASVVLNVSRVDVLASSGENILVVVDNAPYYVNGGTLASVLEGTVDFTVLPEASDTEAFTAGGREAAASLQRALIELGYLQGSADGVFGNGSLSAMQHFQEDNGFVVSESKNDLTMECVLIAEAMGSTAEADLVLQGSEPTPENKFPEIAGKIDFDLTPYCTREYTFSFDVFENRGAIVGNTVFAWASEGTSDLDRVAFEIRYEVAVVPQGDKYIAQPMLVLTSTGARRPYVTNLLMKSGEAMSKTEAGDASGAVDGTSVIERTEFAMTDELQAVWENLTATGAAVVRVEGKYRTFDFTIEPEPVEVPEEDETAAEGVQQEGADAEGEETEAEDTEETNEDGETEDVTE